MREPIYFERDLSWLQFNARVLQEAADESVPLYERLKFLAIYSSNLDEFFRVRVSAIRSFRKMKDIKERFTFKPKKILKEIREIVSSQQEEFGRIFEQEILPALEEHNIVLIQNGDFSEAQNAFASDFFDKHLKKKVTPHLLFEEDVEVWLENKELYLAIQFDEEFDKLALLPIPSDVDRFVVFPEEDGKHCITFIDDVIRANLTKIFPDNHILGKFAIKLSRDAELYLGDEFSGDLIARLEERIKERNKGLPTRFLYDKTMPKGLLKKIRKSIGISKYDLIPGARYHNFNDFFGFPDPTDSEALHDVDLPPQPHMEIESAGSVIAAIENKDVLLSFPYQSYEYVPRLIREAADDPTVDSIKITLYRVANRSQVNQALLYALENGKNVFTFIEAKARFDEESNLRWGKKLKAAGAKVKYSYPGIKVHSKLLFISRKPGTTSIAYLGTGNFNEKTARLYCDHALLTMDTRLTVEVERIFEMLEGQILAPQCKQLLVSPFTTRPGFMELIDKEIANARAGKEAWIVLKMNSLEDRRMIKKLYEASSAGVDIKLIIRGFCCAVPGIEELSENIEIISIIDRFLEHARVYIFGNDGDEKIYLASADWMTRNLDRRVEVVFPIFDQDIRSSLRQVIDIQLSDNVKARVIDAEQSNAYTQREPAEPPVRAQIDTYETFAVTKAQDDATVS